MPVGTCKFCGENKNLRKSHIVPKGLYELKKNKKFVGIERKTGRIDEINFQNGLKECLLCDRCEQMLGVFDKEAIEFLRDRVPKHKFRTVGDMQTYLLTKEHFDYEKLRKFFISLAWRASISSENINLGIYEDIARKIINNEIEDDEDLFLIEIYRRGIDDALNNIVEIGNALNHNSYSSTFRFPNYGVIITTNTKTINNKDKALIKKTFNCDEILIIENRKIFTKPDIQFLDSFYTAIHKK